MIVFFPGKMSEAMIAYVAGGGQAIEKWEASYTLMQKRTPLCFRGKEFCKLYDADELRLIATARRLGVRVVKVDRRGDKYQHVDLIGGPMLRALAEAKTELTPLFEDVASID